MLGHGDDGKHPQPVEVGDQFVHLHQDLSFLGYGADIAGKAVHCDQIDALLFHCGAQQVGKLCRRNLAGIYLMEQQSPRCRGSMQIHVERSRAVQKGVDAFIEEEDGHPPRLVCQRVAVERHQGGFACAGCTDQQATCARFEATAQ